MPFLHVRQISTDPILVMTFTGKVTTQDMMESGEAINAVMQTLNAVPYVIIDLTQCTTDFSEIIHMLRMSAENPHSSEQNDRLCFVGTDIMMRLFLDALRQKQYVGTQIPTFITLNDAISAARIKLNLLPSS